MGHRNPDRMPLAYRRSRCETVADMALQDWRVRSQCLKCRAEAHVDLRVIAILRGARFSLWDQTTPCRMVGCGGQTRFLARAPGMTQYEPVESKPRDAA